MENENVYRRQSEDRSQRDLLTERFLAELSRNIGSEWILVCVALGVPQPEPDHINYDGSFDVQTKIYRGLLRWREQSQGRSELELINQLMEALRQNGRQDLVDRFPDVFGTSVDPPLIPTPRFENETTGVTIIYSRLAEDSSVLHNHGTSVDQPVIKRPRFECMLEKERNKNTALHSMETEHTEVKDFREKLHTLNYLETQKVPVSPLQRTSMMPLENIFAQFLAATYIENQGQIQTFFGQLSSVKVIMELDNVLKFLSGLNPMLGSRISKHIVDVGNADTDICKLRTFCDAAYYPNNKVELLYRLQVNCYKEIKFAQSCKNSTQELSYHVSDVYVDDDCDIETIKATADILTHHHTDIRSLHLDVVSTDVENGIPDSLLTQYLDHTVSLQALYINGYNTNRTLHHISDIFSSLSALLLYRITLTPDALSTLQTTLQSNTAIQTLGLLRITCQVNEDQGPEYAILAGIIQILPDLSSLSTLRFQVARDDDNDIFRDALSRLSHLHGIRYNGTYPDDEYDRDIVQTLSTWSGLRWLYLSDVDLGDSGLQLSHGMLNIEQILLDEVIMSISGWRHFIQSVLNIKHKFDVGLYDIDIDEEVKTMIKDTPEFEVSRDISNDDGSHDICFTRLWPSSQQRQP